MLLISLIAGYINPVFNRSYYSMVKVINEFRVASSVMKTKRDSSADAQ